MLNWKPVKTILSDTEDGEVIIISHNRGTWGHQDQARNNCVVVTRKDRPNGVRFEQFGPDSFQCYEISAYAKFNPPESK